MATTTLDRLLSEISSIIRARDALKLRSYLVIEPPYAPIYDALITELRTTFPRAPGGGRDAGANALEALCGAGLPEAREGLDGSPSWTAFVKFIVQYFTFLRDVDVRNLLETYNLLSELVQYVLVLFTLLVLPLLRRWLLCHRYVYDMTSAHVSSLCLSLLSSRRQGSAASWAIANSLERFPFHHPIRTQSPNHFEM